MPPLIHLRATQQHHAPGKIQESANRARGSCLNPSTRHMQAEQGLGQAQAPKAKAQTHNPQPFNPISIRLCRQSRALGQSQAPEPQPQTLTPQSRNQKAVQAEQGVGTVAGT